PFPGAVNGFEPWAWYNPADPNVVAPPNGSGYGSAANPFATKAKALLYIDTIMGFFCPRAANVLQLPVPVSVNPINVQKAAYSIFPNPSEGNVYIKSTTNIQMIEVYDLAGKMVHQQLQLNAPFYELNRNNLQAGIYFIRLK